MAEETSSPDAFAPERDALRLLVLLAHAERTEGESVARRRIHQLHHLARQDARLAFVLTVVARTRALADDDFDRLRDGVRTLWPPIAGRDVHLPPPRYDGSSGTSLDTALALLRSRGLLRVDRLDPALPHRLTVHGREIGTRGLPRAADPGGYTVRCRILGRAVDVLGDDLATVSHEVEGEISRFRTDEQLDAEDDVLRAMIQATFGDLR